MISSRSSQGRVRVPWSNRPAIVTSAIRWWWSVTARAATTADAAARSLPSTVIMIRSPANVALRLAPVSLAMISP